MSDLRMTFEIVGQETASPAIKAVTACLVDLEKTAKKVGESLKNSLGGDLQKQLAGLKVGAESFRTGMAEASANVAKGLKADVAAAVELRSALSQVVVEQKRAAEAMRGARTATSAAGGAEVRSVREAATARARASRVEREQVDNTAKASAASVMGQARAEAAVVRQRLHDVAAVWKVRERSERAERQHIATVRRERAALRRDALRSGRHALQQGAHAARRLSHPYFDSPAFFATAGAAFGVEAGRKILDATLSIDTAATRFRMFAVPPGADAAAETSKARKTALLDSIGLGIDADKVLDVQAKAVRDGVSPEIARTLPKSIAAAAQVMGGGKDVERLTDSLAEGVQQGVAMGWLKSPADARKFLNLEAGLSNFEGNSAAKQEQFVSAGGLGHGKEMGLDATNSMAFGAMLNASGARTGQAAARFMGQLSQNVPRMFDKYRQAVQSHRNTEEDRAVRSAPGRLGYGSIREMQSRLLAGPEGIVDFAERLHKLDDKSRKLVLEGYGFSEQGGAMLAEIGAGPGKSKAILARAKELASQKEVDDYLTAKFKDWQTSLSFMLKQVEAGWRAIESEVGDVLKDDIISPIRDWWVQVSAAILNSGMKDEVHRSVLGFVNGLGFADVKAMLDGITANARGFDIAGFAKGLGEGIHTVFEDLRWMFDVIGHIAGNGDSESIGKLAAEMLGFAIAAHAIAPMIGIVASLSAAFLALRSVLALGLQLAELTGLSTGLKALAGVEIGGVAASLIRFAGAIGLIAAAVQGAMDSGALAKLYTPKNFSWEEIKKGLWGVDKDGKAQSPSLFGWHPFGGGGVQVPGQGLTTGPHGGIIAAPTASPSGAPAPSKPADTYGLSGFAPASYDGGDFHGMISKASYSPSDSGEVVKGAIVGTERTMLDVKDELVQINATLKLSTIPNLDGGSGGGDGGAANMRYGRGSGGSYRSSPGSEGGAPLGQGARGGAFKGKGANAALAKESYDFWRAKGLDHNAALSMVSQEQGESGFNTHARGDGGSAHGLFQWHADRRAAILRGTGIDVSTADHRQQLEGAWYDGTQGTRKGFFNNLNGRSLKDAVYQGVRRFEGSAHQGADTMMRLGYAQSWDGGGSFMDPTSKGGGGGSEVALTGNLGQRLKSMKSAGLLSNEQCVTLAAAAVGVGVNTSSWRKGEGADAGTLKPGTPVSTFLDRQGRESDRYATGGNGGQPGAHLDHAGVFEKYIVDAAGKRIGMSIAEQYKGSRGIHSRDYFFGKGWGEGNASNYHAVKGENGQYLGGPNNPMNVKVDPKSVAHGVAPKSAEDIARQVPTRDRPRPGASQEGEGGDASFRGAGGQSADNSTMHNTFHIHNARDPHAVGRTVVAHLDRMNSRTHDVDAFS